MDSLSTSTAAAAEGGLDEAGPLQLHSPTGTPAASPQASPMMTPEATVARLEARAPVGTRVEESQVQVEVQGGFGECGSRLKMLKLAHSQGAGSTPFPGEGVPELDHHQGDTRQGRNSAGEGEGEGSLSAASRSAHSSHGFTEHQAITEALLRSGSQLSLDSLPDELLSPILRYAALGSKCPRCFLSITMVCRRMRALVYQPAVLARLPPKALQVSAAQWALPAWRFLALCSQFGNRFASYALGMVSLYCTDQPAVGHRLLTQAARFGCPEALYSLALVYFNGSGGTREHRDARAGAVLCMQAAELGHVDALRELGHCLQDGNGVPPDPGAGRDLLLRANVHEAAQAQGGTLTGVPAIHLHCVVGEKTTPRPEEGRLDSGVSSPPCHQRGPVECRHLAGGRSRGPDEDVGRGDQFSEAGPDFAATQTAGSLCSPPVALNVGLNKMHGAAAHHGSLFQRQATGPVAANRMSGTGGEGLRSHSSSNAVVDSHSRLPGGSEEVDGCHPTALGHPHTPVGHKISMEASSALASQHLRWPLAPEPSPDCLVSSPGQSRQLPDSPGHPQASLGRPLWPRAHLHEQQHTHPHRHRTLAFTSLEHSPGPPAHTHTHDRDHSQGSADSEDEAEECHECVCLPPVTISLDQRPDGWVHAFLRDWHQMKAEGEASLGQPGPTPDQLQSGKGPANPRASASLAQFVNTREHRIELGASQKPQHPGTAVPSPPSEPAQCPQQVPSSSAGDHRQEGHVMDATRQTQEVSQALETKDAERGGSSACTAAAQAPVLNICSNSLCGRRELRASEFRRCSACSMARYCSRVCQAQGWKLGHRDTCAGQEEQR